MHNSYSPPRAELADIAAQAENNSGGGRAVTPPPGVKGWSWGAFLLNWIWAIFNKTWVGLLCLVPYVGFVVGIYLGIKGRELAWRNKRWESLEHFNRVQRSWSVWASVLVLGAAGIGIVAAIAIPAYEGYVHRHAEANPSIDRTSSSWPLTAAVHVASSGQLQTAAHVKR